MYVLVYAPQGIVGEYGSSARVYDTYQEAYKVMFEECHATNDCSDPDAAEWHIYEVEAVL